MGLQKYRADEVRQVHANGAREWVCNWMGGPTLAKVEQCPTPMGPRMVYVTGEADSWFSLPAACKFKGRTVTGWFGYTDGVPEFHAHADSWIYPRVKEEACSA